MRSHALLDLLTAVQRDRLDISAMPLAAILREAFTSDLDLDARSENVWLASTLIQLKISRLLPTPPCQWPEPDGHVHSPPHFDPGQLHQAARFLQQRLGGPRVHDAGEETDPLAAPPQGLNLLEVVQLARKALETARAHQEINESAPTVVRLEEMIRVLESALAEAREGIVGLDELLEAQPDATRRVSLFLAVLELVRIARVRIEQGEAFSPIAVYTLTTQHPD